jgi:thioredoxin reductase (NADPH)
VENKIYDVIVVGGGPSGLTASIYALRSNLKTLLLEEYVCGGQTINTYEIKNFPSFENISGEELSAKMEAHADSLGLEKKFEQAIDFDFSGNIKVVKTKKNEYFAQTVILCMGAKPKKLGLDGEEKLTGRGVSYCAVCDGGFYKDKTVAIVGGGNSAMEDAPYLTNLAKKTYLINRTEKYRALPVLVGAVKNLQSQNKIEILNNTVVTKLNANKKLTSITIKNVLSGEQTKLEVDGLFIEIGRAPNTEIVKQYVDVDEYGYIIADQNLMTSQSGVFVAGDIRQKKLRQIITACADGALASSSAQNYISANQNEK